MIYLIPLGQTEIDWKAYLSKANEVIGRSPTAKLDESWQGQNKTLSDFIATLKELDSPGSDSYGPAGALLEHVHVSYILIAPKQSTVDIVLKSRLMCTVIPTKHGDFSFTVISGTLGQWRSALINCCQPDGIVSYDVRYFGTLATNHFSQANLNQFMSGLNVVNLGDKTIRLIDSRIK